MRVFLILMLTFLQTGFLFGQKGMEQFRNLENATKKEVISHLDTVKKSIVTHYYKEDYSTAILQSTDILKIAEAHKLPLEVAEIHSYLVNSYLHLKDSVNSLKYARKNIQLAKDLNDTNILLGSQIDLGNTYLAFDQLEKAIQSFKKVIPLAKEKNDIRRLFILNYNIAEIYIDVLEDFEGGRSYLEAADAYKSPDFKIGIAGITLFKAHYAFYEENYDVASDLYQQAIAIAKETDYVEVLRKGYAGYINCLVKKGNYEKVYEVEKIKDSIAQAKSEEEIKKSAKILTASLNNAKIKEELENRELRNELILERAETERIFLIISIVVLFLLVSLLLYLLRVIKNRRRLNLELKQKNREYLDAKLESEKFAKAKSRFLSTMSHELRTPLYGIIGLSSVLNNDSSLQSHKSELQSLKFSADYLLNLVNDVLTLNKMDSGMQTKIESKAFILKDFLHNLRESLGYITEQNKNDFVISLDPAIPDWIKGDQTKLSQVLINLLGNALKFTENGKVELIVSLLNNVEKKFTLKFEVKDNGKGIPEVDQKRIFDEFKQLKQQRFFQGSGLGLTIVQKLLIDMGSNIQLVSIPDKGSNFFFELSFKASNKYDSYKEIPDKASLDLLKGKKILVVDDNKINLLVTKKTLETHHVLVEVATSGQESIDKVKKDQYDLVLMDVNMPGMDGIEASKKIHKLNKSVVIIALTAVTESEQENRFNDASFDDTIVKPYKMNDFVNVLAANLSKERV